MPLPPTVEREELHDRTIAMKAYRRADGLYDIEAHLRDVKPFAFHRISRPDPLPAGQPQHDLWLRLVVDDRHVIHAVEAATDTTPFAICPQSTDALSALVGAQIGKGWSTTLRERLARVDNCTHLVELLRPLATTALMGIRGGKPLAMRFVPGTPPRELDSCYAWSAAREMVAASFPASHRPPSPT